MIKRTIYFAGLIALVLAIGVARGSEPSKQSPAPRQSKSVPETKTNAGEWDKILQQAKKEGSVVLAGPPIAEMRKGFGLFTKRYGIQVDFHSGQTAKHFTKIKEEYGAGKHTIDVVMGGPNTIVQGMIPMGIIEPIKSKLLLPEVGCGNWTTSDGCPWFIDPEGRILRLGNWVSGNTIFVNTKNVDPKQIKYYKDLLDPKYKGRIVSVDPRTFGPGGEGTNYLIETLGSDFVKKLYKEQEIVFSVDMRQLGTWIARGNYDILLHGNSEDIYRMLKENLPIVAVEMQDEPHGKLSGGWISAIVQMKDSPHPNAAVVFINWAASKEGAEMLGKATQYPVVRKDLSNDWVPDFIVPKPGVKYLDTHSWEFLSKRSDELDKIRLQLFPK